LIAHKPTSATGVSKAQTAYLKSIKYGQSNAESRRHDLASHRPAQLPNDTWMFEVVFDYGEGTMRKMRRMPKGRLRRA